MALANQSLSVAWLVFGCVQLVLSLGCRCGNQFQQDLELVSDGNDFLQNVFEQGRPGILSFELRNSTSQTIVVESTIKSCGCIDLVDAYGASLAEPFTIERNGAQRFKVIVDTQNLIGKFAQTVFFSYRFEEEFRIRKINLNVAYEVYPPLIPCPSMVSLTKDVQSAQVELCRSSFVPKFEILRVECSNSRLKCNVIDVLAKDFDYAGLRLVKQATLQISFDRKADVVNVSGTDNVRVILRKLDADVPEVKVVEIPISITQEESVQVFPPDLQLLVRPNMTETRSIVVMAGSSAEAIDLPQCLKLKRVSSQVDQKTVITTFELEVTAVDDSSGLIQFRVEGELVKVPYRISVL